MKEQTGVQSTSNMVRLGKISLTKFHFNTNYLVVSQNIIDCGPNNGQSTGGMSVNILNIDNFVALVQCINLFISRKINYIIKLLYRLVTSTLQISR